MDALTFIVEFVKAIAWPCVVVVSAVLFRTEFRLLLGRLRKGKVGPAELEFAEVVNELKTEVAELSPAQRHPAMEPQLASLAAINPRAALMAAWADIEMAMLRIAQTRFPEPSRIARNPMAVIREFAKAELFPTTHIPALATLRQLRNQAAHDPDFNPSTEAVLGYIEVAEEIKSLLAGGPNG